MTRYRRRRRSLLIIDVWVCIQVQKAIDSALLIRSVLRSKTGALPCSNRSLKWNARLPKIHWRSFGGICGLFWIIRGNVKRVTGCVLKRERRYVPGLLSCQTREWDARYLSNAYFIKVNFLGCHGDFKKCQGKRFLNSANMRCTRCTYSRIVEKSEWE